MFSAVGLIGTKVRHIVWGIGTIVEQVDSYILVKFSTKTAKFVYPDAFEKFLEVDDAKIRAVIANDMALARAYVEQQRQAEENARKVAEEHRSATKDAIVHNRKNTKSLDEMFASDYHVEKLARQPIFNYKQVEERFGIRISGFGRGINPTNSAVVLISSIGKSGDKFVYHDKWTVDGDYLYSGEGRTGNQSMTKGNLAIKNAADDGKTIHLFVKFSPQEYYYQGVFILVDYTYDDEKDMDGNLRKEYKFRLRKVTQR